MVACQGPECNLIVRCGYCRIREEVEEECLIVAELLAVVKREVFNLFHDQLEVVLFALLGYYAEVVGEH